MSGNELINGIICRDRNAIRELVDIYHQKIIRTAGGFTGNLQDAEDIAQEVFLEIIRSASKYRRAASLSTWIYRITVNKSLDFIRKRKRKDSFQRIGSFFGTGNEKANIYPEEPHTPGHGFAEKENRRILEGSVDALPQNQKIAFILCNYDDLSYKEIAGIMEISVSSVESLIHRAKMNLRKKLSRHFPEYSKNK